MNVVAWVLDALKTYPEPVQLPEYLPPDATPLQLAEARNRLQQIVQVATELRKLVDQELAGALQGSALRYGNDVFRASNGAGKAKVVDENCWWADVVEGLQHSPNPEGLLAALFPASSVRLTALPKLIAAGTEHGEELKTRHFAYDPPSTPLSVMPLDRAPKYLQDLEEGEIR